MLRANCSYRACGTCSGWNGCFRDACLRSNSTPTASLQSRISWHSSGSRSIRSNRYSTLMPSSRRFAVRNFINACCVTVSGAAHTNRYHGFARGAAPSPAFCPAAARAEKTGSSRSSSVRIVSGVFAIRRAVCPSSQQCGSQRQNSHCAVSSCSQSTTIRRSQ